MTKEDIFYKNLESLEEVKKLNELEKIIFNDKNLLAKYHEYKNYKKDYIKNGDNVKNFNSKELMELLDEPIVYEYISLVEEVDNIVGNITHIIVNSL